MSPAPSASQLASMPSPSEEASPMPVIQVSMFWSAMVLRLSLESALGHGVLRELNAAGQLFHVPAKLWVGEGGEREGQLRAASRLAADGDRGLRHGVTRPLMRDARGNVDALAWRDEVAKFGILDGGEERHALELVQRDQ